MAASKHLIALLKSHIERDDDQFLSVAMQVAAHEARKGHGNVAQQLRELVDEARQGKVKTTRRPIPIAKPTGELAELVSVSFSDTRLKNMALPTQLQNRLRRVLTEQRQQHKLTERGLQPRRKLLFVGPPGSGKTMTASAMAGELRLPLFNVVFHTLITRFMGETASKLRVIFDAMAETRGVYFFDEFDAIGARRTERNDVGEIRRVLNSFLQFLEQDESDSLIIAATNHAELLDPALFRRFDDVIEYQLPGEEEVYAILRSRLVGFNSKSINWAAVVAHGLGLSQAQISRAADEAAKEALLSDREAVTNEDLLHSIDERRSAEFR
jgi:SpoVK/Ycf46/Vps4 family AAA+-type ATPase